MLPTPREKHLFAHLGILVSRYLTSTDTKIRRITRIFSKLRDTSDPEKSVKMLDTKNVGTPKCEMFGMSKFLLIEIGSPRSAFWLWSQKNARFRSTEAIGLPSRSDGRATARPRWNMQTIDKQEDCNAPAVSGATHGVPVTIWVDRSTADHVKVVADALGVSKSALYYELVTIGKKSRRYQDLLRQEELKSQRPTLQGEPFKLRNFRVLQDQELRSISNELTKGEASNILWIRSLS